MLFEVLRRLKEQNIEANLVIVGREGWKWTNPLNSSEYAGLRTKVEIISDITEEELVNSIGMQRSLYIPHITRVLDYQFWRRWPAVHQ